MAANLPPDSAVARACDPDWQWGLPEQLMALVADLLAIANWQRGAGKRSDFPRPISRPGVEPDETETIGGHAGALSLDDMRKWLGWA